MAKRAKVGIGLDVGSRSIQLAVLRQKKNGVTVERVASKELTHDAIVEGMVMDSQVVCDTVAALLKENHVAGKEAAISVSGRRVMIKKIATDEMSDDELDATIAYEAKSNLPFDTSEVSMDYARLPQDVDSGRMELLLVAARNEIVFDAVETLRWAGGKPVLLEAEPFALQAALSESGYLDDQSTVAVLQIGFQSTDAVLFDRGQYESNRDLSVGGKTFVEGLIKELGISFERAVALLAHRDYSPEEQEVVARVAQHVSSMLCDQVERSFPEFFGPNAESAGLRILLCGGGAYLPGLEAELRQHFGADVEIVNPFRRLEVNVKSVDAATAESGTDYTAAVGLALRALGDDHPGFNLLFASDKPSYKKRNYAGLKTVVPVVGFSAMLFGMGMIYLSQENTLNGLNQKLKSIRKETDLYRDKIALVEELTRKRADVSARIDVISELDRNRFARVKVMQLVNNCLPELTWLVDVQELPAGRGAGLSITGLTSSNLKVSQFMTNLLQSKDVRGVDLQVSEQTELAGATVTRFTLQVAVPDLGLSGPPPAPPTDAAKKSAAKAKAKADAKSGK
ncbi:MAG TPA: type IV pilus assembly protein PilM [bacterium]|jgi:type IV pilus assembly protein PilM